MDEFDEPDAIILGQREEGEGCALHFLVRELGNEPCGRMPERDADDRADDGAEWPMGEAEAEGEGVDECTTDDDGEQVHASSFGCREGARNSGYYAGEKIFVNRIAGNIYMAEAKILAKQYFSCYNIATLYTWHLALFYLRKARGELLCHGHPNISVIVLHVRLLRYFARSSNFIHSLSLNLVPCF